MPILPHSRSILPILCVIMSFNIFMPSVAVAYSYGDPSVAEQIQLELINRARANPQAEATRLGLSSLSEGNSGGEITSSAKPPLTLNVLLNASAQRHSQDMANNSMLSHSGSDGTSPFERMTQAGYDWSVAGENVAMKADSRALKAVNSSVALHNLLFIDENYPNRGHRVSILSEDFKEIGIALQDGQLIQSGRSLNAYYLTTDFGLARNDQRSFVLGVVYDDKNNDQLYSAGEGISGLKVEMLNASHSTTASAGGYAMLLDDGKYTLRVSDAQGHQEERSVVLAGQNVKVDIVSSLFHSTSSTEEDDDSDYSSSGELIIPRIRVGNNYYSARLLRQTANPGFILSLAAADIKASTASPSGASAVNYFDAATGLVHLNRVNAEGFVYQVSLKLLNNSVPYLFELASATRL